MKQTLHKLRYSYHLMALRVSLVALAVAFVGSSLSPMLVSAAANNRQELFQAAAQEFGVPVSVLTALSFNESRFEAHRGQQSNDGGYGLMNLREKTATIRSNKDGSSKPAGTQANDFYTLDLAAQLLHTSPQTIKTNDKQNVRGGAAVLAHHARNLNGGNLPGNEGDWYGAIAKYSGSENDQTAKQFADDVYATIKNGAVVATTDSQHVTVTPKPEVAPNKIKLPAFKNTKPQSTTPQPECPKTVTCKFVPAAYTQNNPSDPTDYGNYDYANRPKDMKIKYIVLHDMEGSYDGSIAWFQNPYSYTSTQYMIRSSDGEITQMVQNKDVAWGAGDWYVNMHSINIEHEGFAAQGATWYTEAMYRSSAKLVRYLADKYNIPLDREHILGHDAIPGVRPSNVAGMHWDPGPYWDWNHYMDLLNGKTASNKPNGKAPKVGQAITISPNFATNQPTVQDCSSGSCITLPAQGTNFVYLHTQPSDTAPLLSNSYLHPDGSPGTSHIDDWSATANSGETYIVAGQQGDWTGIWYDGKIGWFYNPRGSGQTARTTAQLTVKARSGVASVSVYGAAYPEASAYPADVPVASLTALYTFPTGQAYATTNPAPVTDYYYAMSFDDSLPGDHTLVKGTDKFYQITYNHRIGYVRASEVTLQYSR